MGPDFERPKMDVPKKWVGATVSSAARPSALTELELSQWWMAFNDPELTSLVERSIESNLDLMQAQARVKQARAARGIALSGILPFGQGTGFARRSRTPVTISGTDGGSRAEGIVSNEYQLGFDAAWELDIFGGVRRGIEAANADLQASVEALRDVLVTVVAEVALNYINLRTLQQRIEIARQNLKAQEHSAKLTRERFEGGFASGLDIANAEALVAATAAQIPLLEASARQAIYNLSVLLGSEPGALLEELSPPSTIPAAPPPIPVGLPSELLRRRPDIRRAEAQIHAATARIGVATADLFPKFTISSSAGFQAGGIGSLLSWANRFWSFGTSFFWRIFDTPSIFYNIELQRALREEDVFAYRKTVLIALQEVENALIAATKEEERRSALKRAVEANRRAVRLATELYTEGQTDFLSVLDSQRSLYSSEDALVQSTGNLSVNLISLYKALGGGWDTYQKEKMDMVRK